MDFTGSALTRIGLAYILQGMKSLRWPLLLLVSFAACDSYHFYRGRFFDETKRWGRAVAELDAFTESRPQDPRACEAHVRAGRIYATVFERCLEARRHFEAAARGFPELKGCVDKAKAGLLNCPDYFPLEPGRLWVYGDSASGGRNMRLDWELRTSTDGAKTVILASLFAGNKRLSVKETGYAKRDWAVQEIASGMKAVPILKYPFMPGSSWTVKEEGQSTDYTIESDQSVVTTVAGTFSGCLKVRETNSAYRASWKYDYYCPGVGRVKTSVGAPGVENPNTELVKFSR